MRIGIDTGGTFTDVVIARGGRLVSFKVPSTPDDPSRAILQALDQIRAREGEASEASLVHGSTVATNAILEGKTARAALVTTAGFEDILEIGRQARPSLYDLDVKRPRPLIPEDLRFGVAERVTAGGPVRTPLDAEAVRRAGGSARQAGAVSCAVCFLHSYLRPEHEEEAGRILAEFFPGRVTLSSALVREFREYERFSTAAANAAVMPVIAEYLDRLLKGSAGLPLRIMGSNGGALSVRRASAEAVSTILSGPAAGVVAARRVCAAAGHEEVISFDMGGTSTDVSLVPGRILLTGETVVGGHPVRTPTIDIHTVGAGGGSIAWIDAGSALKVGPMSAGADPGPACYGKGGPPTVTDANLVLGRILPERFLGGGMRLDVDAARAALDGLAGRLGLSREKTAAGIVSVANVTMARAIRQVSLFRGMDPSRFALCAFGGAGGLHAAELSKTAGTAGVLVPPDPGVFSAWGLIAGDVIVERSATVLKPASSLKGGSLGELMAPLLEAARREAAEEGALAGLVSSPRLEASVDARYAGQSHEIRVPAEGDWLGAFHDAHEERYGFSRRSEEVLAVTLRATARLPVEPPPPPSPWPEGASAIPVGRGQVWDQGAWRDALVSERSALRAGSLFQGPAVITEPGSTVFVPGWCGARVEEGGALRLERKP